ncbi:MAG: hypothetical protein JRI68_23990 [Deltaproteobacteria bacterium]|nr:hypothetical protein [Deltaproteobacteria bacterium]
MRKSVLVLIATLVTLTLSVRAQAQSCANGSDDTISQHGVTLTLDQSYTCGRFANGDYWVVPQSAGGTVTIASMTPAFNGTENGWEVNPDSTSDQGFDSRAHNFDAGRVPALPYVAGADQAIVKAVSVDVNDVDCRPCLDTAIVVTVLDEAPPGDGATIFRPPYFGPAKPLYDTSALRVEALPSLAPTADTPSLDGLATRYERVQLDHQGNWIGRAIHPVQNMPDYGASIGHDSGNAALRLMLDDSVDDKLPALINFVQFGIDLHHMLLGGLEWSANGGHHNGRKLALVFAAELLDDQAMRDAIAAAPYNTFGEDGSLSLGAEAQIPLWGQPCGEQSYWTNQTDQSGNRACIDPYGTIDGGQMPADSYQFCCNSGMWKGTSLALLLMPSLRCLWDYELFVEYVDRWIERGAHTQPDPCAPSDGDHNNYGVTFGPDGNGGCIEDTDSTCTAAELADGASEPCIGRWPGKHGAGQDDGYYTSAFAAAMWTEYRSTVPDGPPDCGNGTGGAGGAGGAGGGATGGAGGSSTGGSGGTSATAPTEDDGGCGCRIVGAPNPAVPWTITLLALLGLAAGGRRRRSR